MSFKKIIFGLIVACGLYADSIGVKETNFSLSTNANYLDGSYFSAEAYGISGSIHTPIYQYIGGSIHAGTSRSHSDYDTDIEYSFDSKRYYGAVNILLRDSSMGGVGAWLAHTEYTTIFSSVDISEKSYGHTDGYGVYGTYYLDAFTVGLSVSDFYYNGKNGEGTRYSIGATWYPHDNMSLSVDYDDILGGRYNNDQYAVSVEYQPHFLSEPLSLMATCTRSENSNGYGLSLRYYFDTKVNLRSRDREY